VERDPRARRHWPAVAWEHERYCPGGTEHIAFLGRGEAFLTIGLQNNLLSRVLAGSVLTGFGQLAHAGKLRLAFRRRRSPKDATNFHRFRELTSQRDVK